MSTILKSVGLAVLALSATARAMPAPAPVDPRGVSISALAFDITMAAELAWGMSNQWASPQKDQSSSSTCDLASTKLPTSTLPASNGTLKYVALGRGMQNYTCASSTSSDAPVSIGALASLYDMSCAAARFPTSVGLLAPVGLQAAVPDSPTAAFLGMPLLGHHYFTAGSTPTFNLDTANGDAGYAALAVVGKAAAPAGAPRGVAGQGFGSVAWLALRNEGAPGASAGQATFADVFRVDTAGGNPPATCDGMQAAFQVEYAAEYWFFQ